MTTKKRLTEVVNYLRFFEINNFVKEQDNGKTIEVNYPIKLTVKNWNEYKGVFVKQRAELYPDYNVDEIAVFERDILNDLSTILMNSSKQKRPLKALIMRYTKLLESFNSLDKTNIVEDNPKDNYSFENLFASKELYEKAVKILIENKYISQENNKLKWIHAPTREYTTNQKIIAMCVVLEKKQYFNLSNKTIYKYIEYEFGIKIEKGNYSRSSNGFKSDYDSIKTKNYSYTSLFRNKL